MLAPCSSEETRTRAKVLAHEIGSWHLDVSIDGIVSALLSLFQTLTGKRPRYKVKIPLFLLQVLLYCVHKGRAW